MHTLQDKIKKVFGLKPLLCVAVDIYRHVIILLVVGLKRFVFRGLLEFREIYKQKAILQSNIHIQFED